VHLRGDAGSCRKQSLSRPLYAPVQLSCEDYRKHRADYDDKPPERGRVAISDE